MFTSVATTHGHIAFDAYKMYVAWRQKSRDAAVVLPALVLFVSRAPWVDDFLTSISRWVFAAPEGLPQGYGEEPCLQLHKAEGFPTRFECILNKRGARDDWVSALSRLIRSAHASGI